MSYRHVWGAPRAVGRATGWRVHHLWAKTAQLSGSAGDKLLWAERQAQARLAPDEALRADLERAFAVVSDDSAHVLTFYASHDDALVALQAHAATWGTMVTGCTWTSASPAAWTPSAHSTKAAAPSPAFTRWNNRCSHLTQHAPTNRCCSRASTKSSALPAAQGADGGAGNPLGLQSSRTSPAPVPALPTAPGQRHRVLLEDLLARRWTGQHIAGLERDETSHTAVAGRGQRAADAGLGSRWPPRARAGLCPAGGRALPPGLPEGNAEQTSHPRAS